MEEANKPNNSYQIKKENSYQGCCLWLVFAALAFFIFGFMGLGAVYLFISNKDSILKEFKSNNYSQIQTINKNINKNINFGKEISIVQNEIIVDSVRFKLLKAKLIGIRLDAEASKYPDVVNSITASSNSQFVMVTLEIENKGTEPLPGYAAGDLKLLDDSQRVSVAQFIDSGSWIPAGEEYYNIDYFMPLAARTVTFIYEIPKDHAGWRVNAWGLDYMSRDEEGYLYIGL